MSIGVDAARCTAERATAEHVNRLRILEPENAAAALGPDREHSYRDLWSAIVDSADNVAYRLAFNGLVAGEDSHYDLMLGLLADELADLDTTARLVDAIAAHDADGAVRAAETLPFWMPLALMGFAPWQILLAQSWSLLYQFWIHTERLDRLPRWYEKVFNTPSHHRVHHGSQEQYLDRNHGGILIVWDRLFGTHEPEGERVRYGLTKNIGTYNPVKVAFGEFVEIGRDVRGAKRWRDRAGYVLRGPGWSPPDRSGHRIGAQWTPERSQPASRWAAP